MVGNRYLHLVIVEHVVFLARIHGLAHDAKTAQVLRPNAELLADAILDVLGFRHRNLYIR